MSVVSGSRLLALRSLIVVLVFFFIGPLAWAQDPLPRCDTPLDISVYPQFPNTDPPQSGVYRHITSIIRDIEVITVEPPDCWQCGFCPTTHPTPARNNGTEPYMCYASVSFCPSRYERTGLYTCLIKEDCRCADGLPDKIGEPGDPVYFESCVRPPLMQCEDESIVPVNGGVCPAKTRESCPTCLAGNPVDFSTGYKIESVTDYKDSGDFPLIVQRDYSSHRSADGGYWNFSFTAGGVKRLEFPTYLTYPEPDNIPVIVRSVDNTILSFTTTDNQTYQAQPDVISRLEQTATGWTYVDTDDRTHRFDVFGQLVSITQRGGLSHFYQVYGNMMTVRNDFGHQLQVHYASDSVSKVVLPDGSEISYEYDADGLIQRAIYSDGSEEVYHYEGEMGQLTGITNELGVRYASFEYTGSRATASEHAGGVNRFEFEYTQIGLQQASIVTNPLGKSTAYSFNELNGALKLDTINRRSSEYSPQSSMRYFYDDKGFVKQIIGFNRRYTNLENNNRGLVTSREQDQRLVSTQWHPDFRLPEVITTPRTEIRYTFDPYDNPNYIARSVMDLETGEIRQWNYTYNSFGQVLSVDGPRSDVDDIVSFSYHDCISGGVCGRLNTVSNALGHVTSYTDYNLHGLPTRVEDKNGVVTELRYDSRQRLVSSTVAGRESRYSYLLNGLLDRMTLPDGSFIDHEYDDAERLVAVVDSGGNRIEWELDSAGNRVEERFRDSAGVVGRQMGRAYDELSQLREIIWAHGGVELFVHNSFGKLASRTDPMARETTYHYDNFNRLYRTQDALGGQTSFAYDIQDNLVSVYDAEGIETAYQYNAFGDLLRLTSADTGESTYSAYDKAGNLLTSTDARGVTVTRRYDALNRPIKVIYPDATENTTYTYDLGVNGIGRLSGITDASGTTSYSYDSRGNITRVVQNIDGQSYTQSYTYNDADRVINMIYPSGRIVSYDYDLAGQVERVNSSGDDGVQTLADKVIHLPFGPVASLTLGNGIERLRTYDLDYRVEQLTDGDVFSRGLAYSSVNNISAITDSFDIDQHQLFAYDDLDRLELAIGQYGEHSYGYDAIGNRLSYSLNGQTESYQYGDDSHRLESVAGRSYLYDASGNTLDDGVSGFVYNNRNRLRSATVGGVTANYQHNALGQRVIKDIDQVLTQFVYDLEGRLIAEASGGEIAVEYAYLAGEPMVMWAQRQVPTVTDTDGDGMPDETDPDDDNDGQSDIDEVACGSDPLDQSNLSIDSDADSSPDCIDTDDDDDGVEDIYDAFPLDPEEADDNDMDGVGDNADADDDNDGVGDSLDAFPRDPTEISDNDNDGTGDNADPDDDNDGVNDGVDAFPFDSTETVDNDTDGIGDNADTDDDNDGVDDINDTFPTDPTEYTDNDADGIGDNADPDDDNDGIDDADDLFPKDGGENSDADGDGVGDNADPDDDNDGVEDALDAFPTDPGEADDTDADGIGNNADTDDDNDGQTDVDEVACGSDPVSVLSQSEDTDSDNMPDCIDSDDDNDGVEDGADAFPQDAGESVDTDGDGIGNNTDLDDDNDGQSDADEVACGANPLDANSQCVNIVSLSCDGYEIVEVATGVYQAAGFDGNVIVGTTDADVLEGTSGADLIVGRRGADIIRGRAGDDVICGGAGQDVIEGNGGNDRIRGAAGADEIAGGRGDDTLYGGNGADLLKGNEGNDTIVGGRGNDEIRGGRNQDVLNGGKDDDEIYGGNGNDKLNGGGGTDYCKGGSGSGDTVANCEGASAP